MFHFELLGIYAQKYSNVFSKHMNPWLNHTLYIGQNQLITYHTINTILAELLAKNKDFL